MEVVYKSVVEVSISEAMFSNRTFVFRSLVSSFVAALLERTSVRRVFQMSELVKNNENVLWLSRESNGVELIQFNNKFKK